ncbi:Uncharacterised protein g6098 [Pycnogonum litorale]
MSEPTQESKRSRGLWWFVFMCSLSGFTYQSYQFLQEYFSYPVVVSSYVITNSELEFPSVTLCGYSKYDKEALKKSKFCKENPDLEICSEFYIPYREKIAIHDGAKVRPKAVAAPQLVRFCKKNKSNKTIRAERVNYTFPKIRIVDLRPTFKLILPTAEIVNITYSPNDSDQSSSFNLSSVGRHSRNLTNGHRQNVSSSTDAKIPTNVTGHPALSSENNASSIEDRNRNKTRSRRFTFGSPSFRIEPDDEKDDIEEKKTERLMRRIESSMSLEDRMKLSPDVTDFLQRCRIMGETCDHTNFTESYSYQFGKCLTINPTATDGRPVRVAKHGSQFGLLLDLHVSMRTRVTNFDRLTGFKILIHRRGEIPFPEDRGIDVGTRIRTSVGIIQSIRAWMPEPYFSRCKDKDPSQYLKNGSLTDRIYTAALCNKDCLQRVIWENCGCLDPRLVFVESRFDGAVCDVDNQTQTCCLEDTIDQLTSGIDCDCTIPCQQLEYSTTVSHVQWNPNVKDYTSSVSTSGLARVQIYFESTDVTVYQVKAKYREVDVFSNLGGQIGLWLGVSFVALYEAAVKLFSICHQHIFKSEKKEDGGGTLRDDRQDETLKLRMSTVM